MPLVETSTTYEGTYSLPNDASAHTAVIFFSVVVVCGWSSSHSTGLHVGNSAFFFVLGGFIYEGHLTLVSRRSVLCDCNSLPY